MRKISRIGCPPVECVSAVDVDYCEFESLGQRVRNAIDQGVKPDTNPQVLEYDTEDDGDVVDPMADPRADHFDVVLSLENHMSELAEKQNSSK